MQQVESNYDGGYIEAVELFLSQREEIREIDHRTAVQREADLINELREKFTLEALEECRLYKELVGSTEDQTSAPNLDLPGDIIQNFMNSLVAELRQNKK